MVTGAGSGIGYAIAEAMAAEGAAVCINYLGYEDEARALAERLPNAIAVKGDVTSAADVAAMVEETGRELGPVTVLVNNAGIEHSSPLLDLPEKDFDAIIAVNLKGAFLCMQACGRAMRDHGRGGSIVNISSIHEDVPFPGFASYCASKGALRMLMRDAAVELAAFGIRVNNIAPGAIVTPINEATLDDPQKVATLQRIVPLRRMGKPEEVAAVAVFLASDAASYVTGSTYYVDGGMIRYAQPL